ncbi:MAG: hypothetical protein GY708_24590 [Actinomycetia bacterium]|nr:hypothetical protein [Actinomycetes bacterium]
MKTTHRNPGPNPKVAKVLLLAAAIMWTSPVFESVGEDRAPPSASITYLGESTPEQRNTVEWAVARYQEAGLNLPDLEVSFPAMCRGKAGLYFIGEAHIDLCNVSRRVALHELAHAWDDAGGTPDREAFMERRGLGHWTSRSDRRSVESGGEQLARIITWGLMDVDTTNGYAAYPGQPRDGQPRRLPGLPSSTIDELREAFTALTGIDPLCPQP